MKTGLKSATNTTNTGANTVGRLPSAGSASNASLSPRQRQVHDLMLKGYTRGQIAKRLGLATGTIKIHVAKVLRKKAVRSRVELLVMANALHKNKAA